MTILALVGLILAFFLFNAGIIALVQPVLVSDQVLRFYLPVCLATVIILLIFMLRTRVSRWAEAILVILYGISVVGGYL